MVNWKISTLSNWNPIEFQLDVLAFYDRHAWGLKLELIFKEPIEIL